MKLYKINQCVSIYDMKQMLVSLIIQQSIIFWTIRQYYAKRFIPAPPVIHYWKESRINLMA